jgi:outer membrane protein assembly factor BamD
MENMRRVVVGFLFVILASVCVSFMGCHRERVNLREMTPDEQFEYAKRIFDKKDYDKAKIQFSIVVMNNPGGLIIEKAQFYLAESYFFLKEYILAVEEYEKLIRSFPQSSFVDDASYKIGMCYYELAPGYALDQEYTLKAISRFQQFVEDYPDSDLRQEVEKRSMECRTKLAKKEFKAGELYRKTSYYSAAIISFDAVLEKYYDTEYADGALYWKGECHRRLKKWAEAEKSFQELTTKYAQSKWIHKAEGKLEDVRRELENSKKVTEKPDE